MVAYSSVQMYKILYEVSFLAETECMNAMLLENVNIFRLMSHAPQVNTDKLREQAMVKNFRTCSYEYFQQNSSAPAP